tara:strand:+ start:1173 stop:3179 length:2007 start_codon:yes stop_codon:yes gene_type:complete
MSARRKSSGWQIGALVLVAFLAGTSFFMVSYLDKEVEELAEETAENPEVANKFSLKLNGDANVTVLLDGAYSEQGATATGKNGADLTDQIVIKGADNIILLPGTIFPVHYEVTDADGSFLRVTRYVRVEGSLERVYHHRLDLDDGVDQLGGSNHLGIGDGGVGGPHTAGRGGHDGGEVIDLDALDRSIDNDDDLLVFDGRDDGGIVYPNVRFDIADDAHDAMNLNSLGVAFPKSAPDPEPKPEPEPEEEPEDGLESAPTEPDAGEKVAQGGSPAQLVTSASAQDALPPGDPALTAFNEDKTELQDTTRKNPKGRFPNAPGVGVGKRGPKEKASGGPHAKGKPNALAEQLLANIAFNAPEKVPYGEPSYIQFVLDPNLDKTEIVKKIREKGHKVTARIKITRTMEVTLTGEDFDITPIAEEKQLIARDDTTEWKWSIVPKKPGKHRVHLVVNAIIVVDGVEMKRSKSFDRYIEIEVTGFQSTVLFLQDNWPWLALAFVPLVFIGPVRSSKFWRNRRAAKGMATTKHDESRDIDVFVSYSSHDRAIVLPLVESLRQQGYNVWVDQGGLHGASQWSEQIVAAIEETSSFILVSSSHSFASHNVVKETSLASEQRKPIIPVFIEEVEVPPSLQYQLAGLQRVEYSDLNHEEGMQRIVEALAKLGIVVSQAAS